MKKENKKIEVEKKNRQYNIIEIIGMAITLILLIFATIYVNYNNREKKVDSEDKFRKDMYKSKRKELSEIWNGDFCLDIANIVRFTPSACNTQPWIVDSSKNELKVYRYKKTGKRGIMPVDMVNYYNQIDIGIFLCFLELCLSKNDIKYKRTLYVEENVDNEKNLTATYKIN